jgi:cytochrome b6-f complex iron-sulfur subunit
MNEPWKDQKISRRDFLKLVRSALLTVSGLIGLIGLFRYLGFQTEPPSPSDFDLGPASNFPPGSRTVLSQVPAVLLQTEKGYTALSLVCPHLGCTVESRSDGFACPCHGSRFGLQGQLVHGPAAKPLTPLRVKTTADGHLHLSTK